VRAAPLLHKVPCWGYVLQETDTTGSINVELCSARGLAPGPLYKELKKGNAVTLPDGTLVRALTPSSSRSAYSQSGASCGGD
jgi:ribonuclease Z